jgi:hypothetical protein
LKSPQILLDPPFSKGKKMDLSAKAAGKALLPLKKGGREGFINRNFKKQSDTIFQ